MEPHEEDVGALAEALRTYQKAKSANRRRKAARELGLSKMENTEGDLPARFELTVEEAAEEAAEVTAAPAEIISQGSGDEGRAKDS